MFIGVLAPGATGSGTYNLSNGIADFDSGLEIGEIGSVNQTGGALTVAAGGTIDLSTAGGSYNLKGGSLTVGTDSLIGSAHEGHFNFGGGTLDTTGDLTDALDGTLSGNSTIHAAGTLILSGTVTGNGALTLTEGTLNASTVNLPQISGVTLRTGTAFNLTVSSNASNTVDTFTGKISGTGNLTTGGIRTSNEGTPIATPATGLSFDSSQWRGSDRRHHYHHRQHRFAGFRRHVEHHYRWRQHHVRGRQCRRRLA